MATDSVHTTAAACDYLDDRLEGSDADSVTVLTVAEGGDRDAGDAGNVARARLTGRASLEIVTREGNPADAILAAVDEGDADVLVLGPRSGSPGTDGDLGLGSTATAVLARAPVPAVVVPLESLDAAGID
ncbi:MAG: universal stress protein [Haloglomus sp.]